MTPDELEIAPGFDHENLEGSVWGEDDLLAGLEKAFDYRGDVTITRKDGTKLEGYVFDRKTAQTLKDSFVRIIPKDENRKIAVPYGDIASLVFTGRDAAAGKSWQAWVEKHKQQG